jgi:DNA-binding CsgD family transcriptional regulator
MTRSPRLPDYTAGLTPRQEQVLALLPTWLTATEIGEKLGISKNTAKTHISAVYRKLGVSCRSEAIQLAPENTTILDMALTWIKSSLSKDQNCPEVAHLPDGRVAMRNGSGGPELLFTALEWECFMDGVHKGEFDRFGESP